MPNPKTIAYQEMMDSFQKENEWRLSSKTSGRIDGSCMFMLKSFLRSSYLHQLEEEVKRLGEKKVQKSKADEILDLAKIESVSSGTKSGWNSALDQEIALCESAIKEIKALQEHRCCDGECNHDDCCGKVKENCRYKCKCHE